MTPIMGWIVTLAIVYLILTFLYILLSIRANARANKTMLEYSIGFGIFQVVVGVAMAILALIAAASETSS